MESLQLKIATMLLDTTLYQTQVSGFNRPFHPLISLSRPICVSVQQERKLYVVTHWETGLLKEVSFAKGDTLRRFLISIGIAFNAGPVSRLYALYPGSTHDQRVKIDSTQKLNSVLADIDSDSDNLEILYVYPEDRSPTSSPTKGMSSPAGN